MSYPAYPEYKDSGVEWLGEVPAHWMLGSFRHLIKSLSNGTTANQVDHEENSIAVSRIETISKGKVDFSKVGYVRVSELDERFLLRPGDVLFSHINSLPMIGNAAVYEGDKPLLHGMNLLRIQPAASVDSSWVLYWLKSKNIRQEVESRAKPAINQASISTASVKSLPALIPPQVEQINITSFLDHETARIDALVEEQQRLIELLKEKRQAVISHAVTRGLDPDVPMKDSGVEWLGEVPEHWGVVPLKYLVTEKVAGPYGASLTKAMYTASGYKVYGQQQVIPNDFSLGGYYISQKKFEEMSRYQIFPGDVLFSVMGTVGKVAVVPPDAELGIINPRLVRYKFAPRINPYFLRLLVMSQHYQASLQESAQGSTMEGLNMAILGDLPILLPSREEQNQIVTRLSQEGFLLEELVNQAKYAMSLLSERRSALISAAVTGKIDARSWKPPTDSVVSTEAKPMEAV